MIKSGITDLPLHYGNCPKWLFSSMKNLSKKISELIIEEFGEEEFLNRLSDPYWFQAFGCVLGFDWHSSGLTTTTTAALKEIFNSSVGTNFNIGVAGGKGKTSKKAPKEIIELGDRLNLNSNRIEDLIKASRLSAKVDNSVLQDGFQLYHHVFFFTKNSWIVIQQGMHSNNTYARRYHWISKENLDFLNEPHSAIVSDVKTETLNLASKKSNETRKVSLDLVKENPVHLKKYSKFDFNTTNLRTKKQENQKILDDFLKPEPKMKFLKMPKTHFPKFKIDFDFKTLLKAYETQPESYEELVLIKGFGKKNLRSLALISNLIYGTELDWEDPVKYSFAHGGKDGWPYPVDTNLINENINFLNDSIKSLKIGNSTKLSALKRLKNFASYFNVNF